MTDRPARRSRGRLAAALAVLGVAFVLLPACGGQADSSTGPASISAAAPTGSSSLSPSPAITPAAWRRLPPPPLPAISYALPRVGVWDGTEVLIAGPVRAPAPDYCKEAAAAYNPATNSWRSLPALQRTGTCLEPLTSDIAVWTGTEMLIWGYTNAAFNPSINRWRRLPDPPIGCPSVAVWTGRQMIGWGGGCGDIIQATGAFYTPATNSWRTLPPAPLAGNGRDTTGAWTGRELIIAGGLAPGARSERYFADAAAYNPRTHAWRSLAPMPVHASFQLASWDGTEMFLLGGYRSGGNGPASIVRPGLAYDPAANRWRWVGAMRYPRGGAVSAWTGHELIVWGGTTSATGVPPYGETYDPVTDEWAPMPRSPLRARYGAVGVWTGAELVIWGGANGRTWDPLADAGAFAPASA